MSDTVSQSTLREWRAHMSNPTRAVALLGVASVLTLLAPFETDELLRAFPRFLYWILVCVLGYSLGYFGSHLAEWIAPKGRFLQRAAIAATLTSIGVFGLVLALNYGFFDYVSGAESASYLPALRSAGLLQSKSDG